MANKTPIIPLTQSKVTPCYLAASSNEILTIITKNLDTPSAVCLALTNKQFREPIYIVYQTKGSYAYRDLLEYGNWHFQDSCTHNFSESLASFHLHMAHEKPSLILKLFVPEVRTLSIAEHKLMLQLRNSHLLQTPEKECLLRGHHKCNYGTPYMGSFCAICDKFFDHDTPEARLRIWNHNCFGHGFKTYCQTTKWMKSMRPTSK